MKQFDVIVVGAGPAGMACAYSLLQSDLSILILEKKQFPRDKVCGDALSADVINQLKSFFPSVYQDFIRLPTSLPSYGVKFFAPNEDHIEIDIKKKKESAPGYICRRVDFDNFLFQKFIEVKREGISIIQGIDIHDIEKSRQGVEVKTDQGTFSGKVIVGWDGTNGVVRKKFLGIGIEKKHHCAGIRAYVKNVHGLSRKNSIELHFLKDTLPGYFWIFPLTDNTANVGLGVLSKEVSERKINLRELLIEIMEYHPVLSKRFKNSDIEGDIKGFGLPLGSKKRVLSGDRFLLTGDAAGLIDPFTGEGIGNALRSGRYAAEHVLRSFKKGDFSKKFNKKYDRYVFSKTWKELRVSRGIQNLLYYPVLFNFVIRKAKNNPSLKKLLTSMLEDVDLKKELLKPGFYMKLFFNRL